MKNSIIFALIMLFSTIVNAHDFEVNGIYYNILSFTDKTVEVTQNEADGSIYNNSYSGTIYIPENVVYGNTSFKVIAIGENAFSHSNITEAHLPEGLLTIKLAAFSNCRELKKCNLPESLTLIDSNGFVGTAMDSVFIPGNVTLMTWCFSGCQMKYLEFAEGIEEIRYLAFTNCRNLRTIIYPASLLRIQCSTFYNCDNIRTIISKRQTSPQMFGSTRPTTGGSLIYNPFTSTDSDERPIYTLLVPNGARESYLNYKTEDGKPGWPVATIEEYDESTDFSKISTEFVQEDMLYAITNTGNHNTIQLINTIDEGVTEIIIRDKIIRNSIEYSITSINPNHITNNKDLSNVHVYSNVPIYLHENTFSANTKLFGTLYVPEHTKNLYENAIEWKDFTNIVEDDEVIPPVPNPKCATPTISFVNGQLIFECETDGVTFVSSVICDDNKNHNISIVSLTAIYRISVYATKDGYDDSDMVTKDISIRGLKGDVNEDGEINIADINTTIGIILGQ